MKIHISYFFSLSKVKNKIFRFHRYIWCTFFFINENVKIKTQIYNFSLMIKNDRIITLYKNFIRVTIHHGWKAGKLYHDVKNEMELNKIVFSVSNESSTKESFICYITTAQVHSTKPELRFRAGWNHARGMSEIRDGENLSDNDPGWK